MDPAQGMNVVGHIRVTSTHSLPISAPRVQAWHRSIVTALGSEGGQLGHGCRCVPSLHAANRLARCSTVPHSAERVRVHAAHPRRNVNGQQDKAIQLLARLLNAHAGNTQAPVRHARTSAPDVAGACAVGTSATASLASSCCLASSRAGAGIRASPAKHTAVCVAATTDAGDREARCCGEVASWSSPSSSSESVSSSGHSTGASGSTP